MRKIKNLRGNIRKSVKVSKIRKNEVRKNAKQRKVLHFTLAGNQFTNGQADLKKVWKFRIF